MCGLEAVLEVERDLHLLASSASTTSLEVAGHGEERAQHEQADRDGADGQRVDEAAAPEAGERLLEEVGERAQDHHRPALSPRPTADYNPRAHVHPGRRRRAAPARARRRSPSKLLERLGAGALPHHRPGLVLQGRERARPGGPGRHQLRPPRRLRHLAARPGPARPQGGPPGAPPHLRPRHLLAPGAARPAARRGR